MIPRERDEAYIAYAETLPVYFALSQDLGLVKIGFSSNVPQRLRSLPRTMRYAGQMTLLGWLPGGPRREAEMHDQFAAYRYLKEWFHVCDELLGFVAAYARTDEPPVFYLSGTQVSTLGYRAALSRLEAVAA